MQNNSAINLSPIGFSAALHLPTKSYDFSIKASAEIEGTRFETNMNGKVTGAQYSSGAAVKMNDSYMLVRAENWSLWFADSQKHFHPID